MQIVRLVPREATVVDPRIIQKLSRSHGPDCAEDVVSTNLSELARHLRRLDDDYRSGDADRLNSRVRSIVTLSDQVGMRHVARVATDVIRCAICGDESALAATLSRLMRLLTQALDEAQVDLLTF